MLRKILIGPESYAISPDRAAWQIDQPYDVQLQEEK